jgi:hypothetical protein
MKNKILLFSSFCLLSLNLFADLRAEDEARETGIENQRLEDQRQASQRVEEQIQEQRLENRLEDNRRVERRLDEQRRENARRP